MNRRQLLAALVAAPLIPVAARETVGTPWLTPAYDAIVAVGDRWTHRVEIKFRGADLDPAEFTEIVRSALEDAAKDP